MDKVAKVNSVFFQKLSIQKLSVQKLFVVAIAGTFLVTLSGCAKYKPKSFAKPTGKVEQKNNIVACAQRLSDSDSRYYFSRNVGKKGYQPVQLYIKNTSDKALVLDASTINLPVENRDHVASRLHIDSTSRVAGWGVGGLFFTPLLIPAVVEAIGSSKANKKLNKDFEDRALDMNSKVVIKPHSALNSVFFVRKENMSNDLQFDLKDAQTEEVTNFGLNI